MIKAIFLDMDDTLCATTKADILTRQWLIEHISESYPQLDPTQWVSRYFAGIYKKLNHEWPELIACLPDEGRFRRKLVQHLFNEQGSVCRESQAAQLQNDIDSARMAHFDFFPDVISLLASLRKTYTLVVITNGPTFSQYPKLNKVNLAALVDHIIVGGEEPEEKPAQSIFNKALTLAKVSAVEAIHVGDSLSSDIDGANHAGIISVWIAPKQNRDPHPSEPDYTVSCVTELPQILQHLSN
jgi:N-acylneuraminate-9-phosphatase